MRTLTRVAASAGALALVTGTIELLEGHVPVLSLAVLYLLAIIPVAVAWGIVYAVGTAIGSMLAFNFFFLPPLYTLTLQDTRNWLALLVFLVTAVVVSELATRSRRRAEEAEAAFRELREVTEERERLAEEALEAEALRRSDAMKTALLRAVSHDLRSPLMAILTSAGALAHDELSLGPDDRRELAETILGEAGRLDRLVSNLLDLSRLEAGPARRRPELWTVDALLVSALEELGPEADRVETTLAPDLGLVRVDGSQLQRVLVNLLENALKFSSPADPVEVSVVEGGGRIAVRIRDRGPGVAEPDSERIFEPFERGSASGPGSGLGLAIARGFAEANGGRVLLEPRADGGSTFVLELPTVEEILRPSGQILSRG